MTLVTSDGERVSTSQAAQVQRSWSDGWHLKDDDTGLAGGILGQIIELRFNPDEPRDTRGRWTRFGGVGNAADVMMKNREGFSVSVKSGGVPVSGYMVAQTDHTHVYPEDILDDHARLTRAIDDMLVAEKSAFSGKHDVYLGGWVHDGKLWLEPSDNISDLQEAVHEGTGRNQIAIWDVKNGQEIQTGGSGGGRITEHANPQGRNGAGARGLRGPARGAAAGNSGRAGIGHPGAPLDLTGLHGHHIPGTPFVYRHGWQEIAGGPAPPAFYKIAEDSKSRHTRPDGQYTAERKALHHRLIREALAGHKSEYAPTATFLGGGPAAGKSTIASQEGNTGVMISADDLMEKLPEYQQMVAAGDPMASTYNHREAADIADELQDTAVHHWISFTLDGTGDRSAESMQQRIDAVHAEGYKAQARYVTVPTDVAVQRAKARAEQTGRMVPEAAIRAIHSSVSKIFRELAAKDAFDQAELWDNRGDRPLLVGRKVPGSYFSIQDPGAWVQFTEKAGESAGSGGGSH